MYSTQTSLTIGLLGVSIGLLLGVILGGISGYYGGGIADTVIQRLIEILQSIPAIPLWMGLAAAVPRDWSVTQVYFAITIILAFLGGGGAGVASGWTALSRWAGPDPRASERGLREGGGARGGGHVATSSSSTWCRSYEPHHRRDHARVSRR